MSSAMDYEVGDGVDEMLMNMGKCRGFNNESETKFGHHGNQPAQVDGPEGWDIRALK